jgi:hypothetical protein
VGGKPMSSEFTSKNSLVKEHEIYRNQLYSEFIVLNRKFFEEAKDTDLYYDLNYIDSLKEAKVSLRVNKQEFKVIPDGELLTQITAHYGIKRLE